MSVADTVASVRARIDAAAARAGRDPGEVTLVAATKTVDAERVRAVIAAGVTDVGENRAQELLEKAPAVDGRALALRRDAPAQQSACARALDRVLADDRP